MDQLSRHELRSVQGITTKRKPQFYWLGGNYDIIRIADNLTCVPLALGRMYDLRSENVVNKFLTKGPVFDTSLVV